jgi:ORF 12 gene product N-terminal
VHTKVGVRIDLSPWWEEAVRSDAAGMINTNTSQSAGRRGDRFATRFGLSALLFVLALLGAGCGSGARSSAPASVVLPHTPAGAQACWLLRASANLPIPAAELAAHFGRRFLRQVSASELNAALAGAGAALPRH